MSDTTTPEPGPAPAPRSLRQTLASMVLGFEILIVFLAALVIWGLAPTENGTWGLPRWVALVAGGALIVLLVLTIGLLRYRWGYAVGWGLQVLILAAGFFNPAMFFVGALFGGMWWYCMIVGARLDRDRAATNADPGKEQE